ncbi:MAG TPA: sulfatase-like hydrolase/transferase [Vicinamibacteria bacterium]|nr:sulfatase-like hydrolase/transferase [Vicinamibacteria bacterium]
MLPALLLAAAVSSAPNVVLVTIDTLRADRVGAYGHRGAQTPTLDRLAREGVLLEDVVVQVPQTRPSHATILTGLLPYEHGLRDNYSPPLAAGTPTLATLLRAAGWDTAAFIGAYPVSRLSGLDQGFALYDDPFSGPDGASDGRTERRAAEVVDRALGWLRKPRTRPFLAWVHLFDPHAPYDAPAPWRQRFAKSPYDGEVAYADAEVGRLVGWLDSAGLRDRTLVVVTSDHGEGLGEHGEDEHMFFVYDSTLRVPLVLSWPGRLPAGARASGQFRGVDLLATVLDLVGVKAPATSGVSRAAALRSGARIGASDSYAETLYSQLHFGCAPLRALRGEGWKYVEAPRPELYHLADDPGERRNLVDQEPSVVAAMRQRLLAHDRGGAPPTLPAVDPEAAERLAALGYVESAGAAGGTQSSVDPKDRIDELQAYQRDVRKGMALYREKDVDAAVRVLSRAARSATSSFNVNYYLGRSLVETRRYAEAVPYLEKAVGMAPARQSFSGLAVAPVYAYLAEALSGAGRNREAFRSLVEGLAAAPKSADLLRAKGSLLARQGDLAGARTALEEARSIDARDPRLHVELSGAYRNLGELDRARAAADEAVRLDPRSPDAHVARGLVLGALGREADAGRAFREALRLAPAHPDALFYLGAVELRAGRAASAVSLLEKLVAAAPEYPQGRQTLALAQGRAAERPPAR